MTPSRSPAKWLFLDLTTARVACTPLRTPHDGPAPGHGLRLRFPVQVRYPKLVEHPMTELDANSFPLTLTFKEQWVGMGVGMGGMGGCFNAPTRTVLELGWRVKIVQVQVRR